MSVQSDLLSIVMQMGLQGGQAGKAMLVGDPGIAKTDVIMAMAAEIQERSGKPFPCDTVSAGQSAPEDIIGIPMPNTNTGFTDFFATSLAKNVLEAERGVMFIDEYSSGTPAFQGASLTLVQSGRVADKVLSDRVARIAAMNPTEMAANGSIITAPAANRFLWIDWSLELSDWIDFMLGGKGAVKNIRGLPKDWEANFGPQAKLKVASFIKRNPGLMLKVPEGHNAGCAWPSPRTWFDASRYLAAVLSLGEQPESELGYQAVRGLVGEGAADAFMAWLREMDLPDPEEVLKDPKNFPLPEAIHKLDLTLASVATAATDETKTAAERKARWEAAWVVIERVFVEMKKEDAIVDSCKILALKIPKGAGYPKVLKGVGDVLKKAGIRFS